MTNAITRFVFFIVLIAGTARADFTFVHVSDIHIGAGDNAKTDAALFAEIAALKPAFVINTGDVCEYGTDVEYAQYRDTLKSLGDIAAFVAPGNHDVRWNPRGKEGFTRGVGQPLYQSWDHENVHFVLLDSTVLLEHWGHISAEELKWLKADLEKVGVEKPVIIGFHHWVGRETVQVDNEQALFDLVKPYHVVLWLQGHGHADIDWNVNGVPATMVKGLYQGSYDIVRVTNDDLVISKRFIPDPKKKGELIQDKTVPDETIPSKTKDLMRVPLKRRDGPTLDTKLMADLDGASGFPEGFTATLKPIADATLTWRLDDAKPSALPTGGATIPAGDIVQGEHRVTLTATLADGRSYQKAVPFTYTRDITPAWSIDVGGEVQSQLAVRDGLLYVSTMGSDLVAVSTKDGKERFRIRAAGPIFGGAHVEDGVVYFGSADHFVYAADVATGVVKWKRELGGAVLASVNVSRGVLCVGTTDTHIYGLDSKDGATKWIVPGENMFQSKPASYGQTFFVGGWDNYVRAIDLLSGEEIWKLELGRKQRPGFSAFAPAVAAPTVGDGSVFISTNDGILHALSIDEGKETWRIDRKKMGYSSPLHHDGKVYAALSDEGKVFCADAKTGAIVWQTDTGAVIYDSSFCFGGDERSGKVFIGNVNGTLNAIDAATGKIDWQYRLAPGHLLGSPVADDHFVYVGSMSGQVVALPINASPSPGTPGEGRGEGRR